ncbi:MAG: four helix bundle protein [bacterium]
MERLGTLKGKDLADRLARYAAQVLRVSGELPSTKEGRHVQAQLLRSATAPGAHYAEARSGQSSADFIHKVALAAKEARESVHWLRTCIHARFVERDIRSLVDEGEQLTAILTSSLQTARTNQNHSNS